MLLVGQLSKPIVIACHPGESSDEPLIFLPCFVPPFEVEEGLGETILAILDPPVGRRMRHRRTQFSDRVFDPPARAQVEG